MKVIRATSTSVSDVIVGIRKAISESDKEKKETAKKSLKKLSELFEDPSPVFYSHDLKRSSWHTESMILELCKDAGVSPEKYEERFSEYYEDLRIQWRDNVLKNYEEDNFGSFEGTSFDYIYENAVRDEIVEVVERLDEIKAKRKAEIELKEKEKEASRFVWSRWAREFGSEDLKCAIAEGYPLGGAIEREVDEVAFPEVEGTEKNFYADDEGERKVPNKAARQALKVIKDAIEKRGTCLPGNASLSVGRIHSASYYVPCPNCDDGYCGECDSDGEIKTKRTAIQVALSSPHHSASCWYVVSED